EVLAREVEERSVRADAGIRDENVEPAEALDGRGDDRLELLELADVARLSDGVESEVVAASRCEPELDAALVEHARDRRAHAAACACDERHLAFECHRPSFRAG